MINWHPSLAASCFFAYYSLYKDKIKLSQSDGGPLAHFFIVFFKGFRPVLKERHNYRVSVTAIAPMGTPIFKV